MAQVTFPKMASASLIVLEKISNAMYANVVPELAQ